MVRYKQSEIPPITEERRAELKALAERPDSEIDYSEIPPLTDEFWKKAVRNPFYRPAKIHTTMRIDADIVAWLKSKGHGYQTRLNAILRRSMLEDMHQTK
jgi:uncharacterized protein (DUF4415 family)